MKQGSFGALCPSYTPSQMIICSRDLTRIVLRRGPTALPPLPPSSSTLSRCTQIWTLSYCYHPQPHTLPLTQPCTQLQARSFYLALSSPHPTPSPRLFPREVVRLKSIIPTRGQAVLGPLDPILLLHLCFSKKHQKPGFNLPTLLEIPGAVYFTFPWGWGCPVPPFPSLSACSISAENPISIWI